VGDLLLAAVESFPAWDDARASVGRGVWRRALERTGGGELAAGIEKALAVSGNDPDLALARLVRAAHPDLPFTAGGLSVTLENLRRAAARAARKEASAAETRLVDLLLAGKLAALHAAWAEGAGADPAGDPMGLFLAAAPGIAPSAKAAERRSILARALEALASPDAWLFPAGALARRDAPGGDRLSSRGPRSSPARSSSGSRARSSCRPRSPPACARRNWASTARRSSPCAGSRPTSCSSSARVTPIAAAASCSPGPPAVSTATSRSKIAMSKAPPAGSRAKGCSCRRRPGITAPEPRRHAARRGASPTRPPSSAPGRPGGVVSPAAASLRSPSAP
jgi:hypothetical protein